MKEKLMPYRWIAYVLAWYIFQMYPVYLQMTSTSEEYLVTLFLISVVVIFFCSYKFGSEKGKVLGILMFFNSCAYRRICCVLHVCNVAGNELAQLDHTKDK